MSGGPGGIEDLLRDIELGLRRDEWLASPEAGRLVRDVRPRRRRPEAGVAPGDALLARRPEATRARYDTLIHLEATFPRHLDFACVIALASQVLEGELTQLLVEPARPVAGALESALARKGKGKQAEALAAWAAGRVPATIGTASLVVLALRYGLEAGDPDCEAFLAGEFTPPFTPLARDRTFGAAIDEAREKYRNPACHGARVFAPGDYAAFSGLLVGRERVADWASGGPSEGAALLHHLLAGTRRLPDGAAEVAGPSPRPTPAARLLELAGVGSGWPLTLSASPAGVPPTRDLVAHRGPPRFRLGDGIRLTMRSDRPCRVALIDIGTSGAVTLMLPNPWQPAVRLEAGVPTVFPDPADHFDLTLEGAAGREWAVLLAWQEGLDPPLKVEAGGDFHVLREPEVARLCAAAAGWPPASWSIRVCEFLVEAPEPTGPRPSTTERAP